MFWVSYETDQYQRLKLAELVMNLNPSDREQLDCVGEPTDLSPSNANTRNFGSASLIRFGGVTDQYRRKVDIIKCSYPLIVLNFAVIDLSVVFGPHNLA